MLRNPMIAATATALLLAAGLPALSAQETPDFSGRWTMVADADAPRPAGPRGRFAGLGQAATITQDEATLTVVRTTPMGESTSTYNLDGTESTNTLSFGDNSIEQVSTASWDGGTLTIRSTMSMGGNPVETSLVLSLDADGRLVVESTRPGRGGGAGNTTTTVYAKEG